MVPFTKKNCALTFNLPKKNHLRDEKNLLEAIQLSRAVGNPSIEIEDEMESQGSEELTCNEPLCAKNTKVWPTVERLQKHKWVLSKLSVLIFVSLACSLTYHILSRETKEHKKAAAKTYVKNN